MISRATGLVSVKSDTRNGCGSIRMFMARRNFSKMAAYFLHGAFWICLLSLLSASRFPVCVPRYTRACTSDHASAGTPRQEWMHIGIDFSGERTSSNLETDWYRHKSAPLKSILTWPLTLVHHGHVLAFTSEGYRLRNAPSQLNALRESGGMCYQQNTTNPTD